MLTKRNVFLVAFMVMVGIALFGVNAVAAAPSSSGDPVRGQYIFAVTGSCGCHGANLAGYNPYGPPFGETFNGPFGSVPAANITQDQVDGIGNWTDAQIVNALRNGVDNQGHQLFPIMPYNTFHFMSDADVNDLVAFLRTVPAVPNNVAAPQLTGPVPPAPPLPPSPAVSPTGGVERGRYLVQAVADCGSCHTPQTPQGAPDMTKLLAGAITPLSATDFMVAPNITSDKAHGIGDWTQSDVVTYLKQGVGPNGRTADGLMGEVIHGLYNGLGFNKLTDADAGAIAAFLQTVPASANVPMAPPTQMAPIDPWVSAFIAAHGYAPTNADRADRTWSLTFAAQFGRSPTDADWLQHWLQTGQ